MIPPDIRYDPNATPPQFTNNEDSVIEVGTHIRVKIVGTRAEVGTMYAIASIKEDYLGWVSEPAGAGEFADSFTRCLQGA
jgi:DNA-directed RNA polymerase II subunit RPB7